MASNKKMSRTGDGEPTVKAVLAYAAQLRHEAEIARARDPFAEPYAPSNDAARKVSQQYGPARALQILAGRARAAELRAEEAGARASAAHSRHVGYQLVALGEREVDVARMTLGERLDQALQALGVLSEVSAARLDSEPVSGGKPSGGVPFMRRRECDLIADDAQRVVERAERELERSRRRMVETGMAA